MNKKELEQAEVLIKNHKILTSLWIRGEAAILSQIDENNKVFAWILRKAIARQ